MRDASFLAVESDNAKGGTSHAEAGSAHQGLVCHSSPGYETLAAMMSRSSRLFASFSMLCAILFAAACGDDERSQLRVDLATSTEGMVVSETSEATRIGRDVLAEGGNAVDAAVAVAFALAVTWPEAGNIGGGGFMMVAPPDGEVVCIDYRETAPAAATRDMFVDNPNRYHHRAVGTPGTVRGLFLAHAHYGRLPWQRLVEPAAELARNGFEVDEHLAASLNGVLRRSEVFENDRYQELRRSYGHPHGRDWQPGDRLVLPDLAATLAVIAEQGAGAFYEGPIADQIVAEMESGEGLITREDLAGYEARIRPALSAEIKGFEVFGAPPPNSGGTTLLLILRMLEQRGIAPDPDSYWNAEQIHLMAEAMKRAFRERAAHVGDPDYVSIPGHLYDDEFIAESAGSISLDRATPSLSLVGDIELSEGPYEGESTTHFSVFDGEGMAVSNTYTIEQPFGSRVVVQGAGFLLNNEMGDFNWYPGYTNRKGKIGTEANLLVPGKRMISSTTPTIVKRDGEVVLLTGSPGGRTIINTVSSILVQTLFFGRPLGEAVEGPRIHHQWFPDVIEIEPVDGLGWDQLLSELQAKGHEVKTSTRRGGRQGSAHSIWVDRETHLMTGVADWRRGGKALGVEHRRNPD
jgi:gamma-glutamyltranspeptidase/glutathione hydrolase